MINNFLIKNNNCFEENIILVSINKNKKVQRENKYNYLELNRIKATSKIFSLKLFCQQTRQYSSITRKFFKQNNNNCYFAKLGYNLYSTTTTINNLDSLIKKNFQKRVIFKLKAKKYFKIAKYKKWHTIIKKQRIKNKSFRAEKRKRYFKLSSRGQRRSKFWQGVQEKNPELKRRRGVYVWLGKNTHLKKMNITRKTDLLMLKRIINNKKLTLTKRRVKSWPYRAREAFRKRRALEHWELTKESREEKRALIESRKFDKFYFNILDLDTLLCLNFLLTKTNSFCSITTFRKGHVLFLETPRMQGFRHRMRRKDYVLFLTINRLMSKFFKKHDKITSKFIIQFSGIKSHLLKKIMRFLRKRYSLRLGINILYVQLKHMVPHNGCPGQVRKRKKRKRRFISPWHRTRLVYSKKHDAEGNELD